MFVYCKLCSVCSIAGNHYLSWVICVSIAPLHKVVMCYRNSLQTYSAVVVVSSASQYCSHTAVFAISGNSVCMWRKVCCKCYIVGYCYATWIFGTTIAPALEVVACVCCCRDSYCSSLQIASTSIGCSSFVIVGQQ